VASAFQKQVDDPKNCIRFQLVSATPTWCATGGYIKVLIPSNPDNFMVVGLAFNGGTLHGKFDCVATIEATQNTILDKTRFAEPIVFCEDPAVINLNGIAQVEPVGVNEVDFGIDFDLRRGP
jgi:hypothetical protein